MEPRPFVAGKNFHEKTIAPLLAAAEAAKKLRAVVCVGTAAHACRLVMFLLQVGPLHSAARRREPQGRSVAATTKRGIDDVRGVVNFCAQDAEREALAAIAVPGS